MGFGSGWTRGSRGALTGATVVLAASVVLAGCAAGPAAASGPVELEVWSHSGTEAEVEVLQEQVRAFNAAQPDVRVVLTLIPEGEYGNRVQAAIMADSLPDVVDVDGPLVASYAYQGALVPLDDLLEPTLVSGLLQSIVDQGTYEGELYSVGTFESGLALFGDRRELAEAGVQLPAGGGAWSGAEFTAVLQALAAVDPDGEVLDLKRNYGTGEWLTYGFSPLVWSAGGDLVDRSSGKAEGTLDSPATLRAFELLGQWSGYVDDNTDDAAFVQRRVALSWVGHWAYPAYAEALGEDLVVLPLPDLGYGTRSGQGSWSWAVTTDAEHPDEAARWLSDQLRTENVLAMTAANGAVPGTVATLEQSTLYAPGSPLAVMAENLVATCGQNPRTPGCVSVVRPVTPAYPTISSAFAAAVAAVLDGADPEYALARASKTIDRDLAANGGYPR